MSFRIFTIGAALVLAALPAAAQQRGTVEFGAFGSAGRFDNSLTLEHGYGGGGRVGVFLDPRVAVEFEKGEMRATRTLGLKDVNVGILAGHLVGTLIQGSRFSMHVGAGAGASTETNFLHTYGVNALVGAKVRLSPSASLRIDGISDWFANNDWKSFQRVHVGLSLFRNPTRLLRTVEVPGPVTYVTRPDTSNAADLARLRQFERDYRNLRDSLARTPASTSPSSAAALATMEEKIHFATDKSVLSDTARAILDSKVAVFQANPGMRIVIVGNTDERATDQYNMALGERRSAAAKAYLVSKGIDPVRIEVSSRGERNPEASGTSPEAQALNRRAAFRLLMSSDYLVPAKP
ncbi:MAG: pal [Gemmatimonadetes bacterium]|nr:pal [Gemmatimonadota bacterium]